MTAVAAEPAAPAADDELGAQWKQRQPDIPPPARADLRRRIVVTICRLCLRLAIGEPGHDG